MTGAGVKWRWVGEDGTQHPIEQDKLFTKLTSEALPAYTLVWRPGWAEWLPAMQVAELAWALPAGTADTPATPKRKDGQNTPPSPPLYRYPVIKRRAAAVAKGERSHQVQQDPTPVPGGPAQAPARSGAYPIVGQRGGTTERKPDLEISPAAYSEIADDTDTHLITDRPSAVPEVHAEPTPQPQYVAPHAPARLVNPAPAEGASAQVTQPPPTSPKATDQLATSPAASLAPVEKRSMTTLPILGGAAVLALLVVGVLIGRGSDDEQVSGEGLEGAATASAAAESRPGAASPGPAPCRPTGKRNRLEEQVDVAVTPSFARVPGSTRVVVGYAESSKVALGITLDPKALDRDQVFRDDGAQPLISVRPRTEGERLALSVVREGHPLGLAVGVNSRPPFLLGGTDGALSSAREGLPPQALWKLDARELTPPSVATLNAHGHIVALRAGGAAGKVRMGWVGLDGTRKTELGTIPTPNGELASPVVAVNETAALLAVAWREGPASPWRIELASAPLDELPTEVKTFASPTAGDAQDTLTPAVAGLSRGGWLLQWSEGPRGSRRVYVATLDAQLELIDHPALMSAEDGNSGAGAIWSDGQDAISLFLTRRGDAHELWAAGLDCTP